MKSKFRPLLFVGLILLLALAAMPASRAKARNPMTVSTVFRSDGALDGWVLETAETSGLGGTKNAGATTFNLGDDAANRQYRVILHFDTSAIPDTATITSVKLKIKRAGAVVGTDPFTTHGKLILDIRRPFFGGTNALDSGDFQAAATKNNAGQFSSIPVSGGKAYLATLPNTSFQYINLKGTTQFRLRFSLDDDNDQVADFWKFLSGNYSVVSDRPELEIQYNP